MNRITSVLKKLTQPIRLVLKEMKLVEWISFSQTAKSTALVLVISIVIGIMIVVFDIVFFDIRNAILDLKL